MAPKPSIAVVAGTEQSHSAEARHGPRDVSSMGWRRRGLDPWSLLGVTPAATVADINAAYRRQALICHPDRAREGQDQSSLEE
eukprot:4401719-Lingulodinium_polyedra.AAC.1